MFLVTVSQLGASPRLIDMEYASHNEVTVYDVLCEADIDTTGISVTIDGKIVELNTAVHDADRIIVGKNTKGNVDFTTQFCKLGANPFVLEIPEGTSIYSALKLATPEQRAMFYREDGSLAGQLMLKNGDNVDDSYIIPRPTAGDARIIIAVKTKGNR